MILTATVEKYRSFEKWVFHRFVFGNRKLATDDRVAEHAVLKNDYKMLRYLVYQREKNAYVLAQYAAKHADLPVLKFLKERGVNMNFLVTSTIAECGNLVCLKFACAAHFEFNHVVSATAAQFGQLHCLAYLHIIGCPWDVTTPYLAAKNGHLTCLRYAATHGCAWHDEAPLMAAANGHLGCLQFSYECGRPLDIRITAYAAAYNHCACVQYALDHGCKYPTSINEVDFWRSHGQFDVAENVETYRVTWNEYTCATVAFFGFRQALVDAYAQNQVLTSLTVHNAAKNGFWDCVEFAVGHNCPIAKSTADVVVDKTKANIQGLMYLHKNGLNWDGCTCEKGSTCREYSTEPSTNMRTCVLNKISANQNPTLKKRKPN